MFIKSKILGLISRLSGVKKLSREIEKSLLVVSEKLSIIQNSLTGIQRHQNTVQTICVDKDTLITKLFSGAKMYLNPKDLSVAAHIAIDGIWEPDVTRAWLSVLKADDVVLDIGANFGYFGLLTAWYTRDKNSKIIMFEANKKIIPYINKSLSINWLNERARVENLAISDANGKVELNVLKNHIGSSSIQSVEELSLFMDEKMNIEVDEVMKVDSVTVDSYCKDNKISSVNLMKMDIEGYEEKAYKGMGNLIKNSKDLTLFIEFTKESYKNPKQFYETMLKDFGNVYVINSDGTIVRPKNNSYENIIGQPNVWSMPIFSKNNNLDKEKNFEY